MDHFSRNLIFFIAGSLTFAFGMIFALRKFGRINIKTRAKFATLLGFVSLVLGEYTICDLRTTVLSIGYSIPIAILMILLIWMNKGNLNQIKKGVVQLFVGLSLPIWGWLFKISVVLAFTLGFAACFISIAMEFFLEEKFWGLESH